ncbi:uncharacterized protein plekhg4 [Trichomycterus rosablanca]|uniref:uncharacterized protein plekhg4 n=1 Tax=Trichomycterus rosablanca TaxID=2290929 RepID=UPI002F358714
MDSESLDSCIQSTLAALYPPFEATGGTVLCQVLDVVESSYRGDGLHYLIDFLVPAKRILQSIQQDACFPYGGFLFRHEGWPLCVREKIIIQLSSLDKRVLQPGDFYLQVAASAKSPPRITLKCLSQNGQYVEDLEIPELAYTSLFSMDWLDSINRERNGDGQATLEHCLLSADNDIYRVPWEDVVHPEFVSRPPNATKLVLANGSQNDFGEEKGQEDNRNSLSEQVLLIDTSIGQSAKTEDQCEGVKFHSAMEKDSKESSGRSSAADESEGEYVELEDITYPRFSPQKGSLTQSISTNFRNLHKPWTTGPAQPNNNAILSTVKNGACPQSIVCAMLIEENLSEPYHNQRQEKGDTDPASHKGTLQSDCLLEHVPENECVLKHSDCNNTALNDLNTDIMHPDTEAKNEVHHCPETHCFEPDCTNQVLSDSDQTSAKSYTTENSRDIREVECCFQTGNKVTVHITVQDTTVPNVPLSSASISTESQKEMQRSLAHIKDPLDQQVSQPADCVYSVHKSESNHSSCDAEEGSPRSSVPLGDQVDPAIVCKQPAESQITASHPGQERTEFCMEIHKRKEENKETDLEEERKEQVIPQDTVEPSKTGTKDEELRKGNYRVLEAEGVAVDAIEKGRTPQTGLVNYTPKSGTAASTYLAWETGKSLGTDKKDAQERLELVSEKVESQSMGITSKGVENAGILGCSTIESEQVTVAVSYLETKESAGPQRPGIASDVPDENGGTPPEQMDIQTSDALLEEDSTLPVSNVEEQMDGEKTERIEEQRLQDELTSSLQLGAEMKSHQQELLQVEKRHSNTDDSTVKLRVPQSASHISDGSHPLLTEIHNISPDILSSGVLCLPGTRDKSGRALVTVTTQNTAWLNPNCNSSELGRIMIYFYSTVRKEVRALGLTVLVDARRCSSVPALFKTFIILQEAMPGCIHTVLLLADKDATVRMEKPTAVQVELLTSLKSLHKHIVASQLPTEFDGTFPMCHTSWISFRKRVEQLTSHCQDAINLLQSTICSLESTALPSTAEEAQALLCMYKELMRSVLEDGRLMRLQLEGGAALSRLRKEETSVSLTEDYRDAIEDVSTLYNHVDELVHKLVMLSNKCTQELQFVLEFKNLEAGFKEVGQWIEEVGESKLQTLGELEDSLEQLRSKQALFRDFYTSAYYQCKSGEALLKRLEKWEDIQSTELQVYEVKVRSFWLQLHNFSQRVEDTKEKIDKTVRLYEFFDKAYEWALEGMRHLACVSMEDCSTPERCQKVMTCLESYRSQHAPIPDSHFQEMKDLAVEIKSEQGLRQWKFAWSKCQETKQMFEKKLEAALRARDSGSSSSVLQERSSSLSFSCRKAFSRGWVRERLSSTPCSPDGSRPVARKSLRTPTGSPCHSDTQSSHSTPPSLHQLTRSVSTDESPHSCNTSSSLSPSPFSLGAVRRRILRKTQSFDATVCETDTRYGTCQRTLGEPVHRGNTGVFIKGLEVSSTEVTNRPYSPRLTQAHNWALQDPHHTESPVLETRTKGSKLRHIVDEMVTTEREYVRSLRYIIDHYFPEMERPDLPQDLRGKRSVIFGNLEKLVDFHSQYFLKELESCCNHPLRVSHCFLRHQDLFGMYALYSKNKPKSDLLLASHGNSFFRNKQLELEDKMDLASYLLKPIQRMSKYALLLKDLIKEVNEAQEQELSYLRAAAEMVKFQLRHGNDLLAMDAIRDCDVNLKEQGQLVRQDEFTIWYGRKKCQRHVFLFEDLVLFSKPKRIEGGFDVYIYKHSFKTADVGLTETSGENGLRFEIWFRRRTSKNHTYILQAASADIKQVWTADVARILWQQATRNKEIRMQEMVSMGVGNKPFLDIKPSDAAINDRAIDYIMKGRGARTRASIAVSLFDHSNPFKRAAVSAPVNGQAGTGGPSSSTLLGPLNLHMYSSQTLLPGEKPLISPCIEEDELEHETSSQPSMTTESSGSSSHCLSGSGSSGSDSGCVTNHLPEALSEEPSSPCDTSCYSSITSPSKHKPSFNTQYISEKDTQVLGPSTIV